MKEVRIRKEMLAQPFVAGIWYGTDSPEVWYLVPCSEVEKAVDFLNDRQNQENQFLEILIRPHSTNKCFSWVIEG